MCEACEACEQHQSLKRVISNMIVCCCARRCTGETGTPFEGCSTWAEYITACVAKLDEEPKHRGRPVLIVAHSHGTIAGYSVARRLGLRVSKLCVRRAPAYICPLPYPARLFFISHKVESRNGKAPVPHKRPPSRAQVCRLPPAAVCTDA